MARDRSGVIPRAFLSLRDLAHEPELRDFPIAHDSVRRNTQDGCGLFQRESAEIAKLDDAALAGIHFGKGPERVVKCHDVARTRLAAVMALDEGHADCTAAALLILASPGGVDEYTPHQSRGDRKEMRSILPPYPLDARQAQVDLIHERGRLKGVAGPLAAQLVSSDPSEVIVDKRHKPFEGGLIAAPP